jgi:urease accessory protein
MTYVLWQLIDSSFPSGGFAHSGGLEAAVHHGHVSDGDRVRSFARQTLAQAGHASLPFVTAAHLQPDRLPEWDSLADVFLSNPVANRASRAQGRALLTSAVRAFPGDAFASIDTHAHGGHLALHQAPVFGAVFQALHVCTSDTQRAFLFITLRGVASAAVRLGVVGSYEAQTIQASLAPDLEDVLCRCGALEISAAAHTAPLIDLFQSTHDRLYSKLFQS